MTVGEQIKKYRKKAGLSQRELGEKLGVSQQHIAQYESGKRTPKIENLNKIADALKLSLNDLIPESFERTISHGDELLAMDYNLIEIIISHKIFSDKEKKKILNQIEKNKAILEKMEDIEDMEAYSNKTQNDLIHSMLNMILNKFKNENIKDIIIILSCFLSLPEIEQRDIIEILINHCY